MQNKKLSITIGIPAYNEEVNISLLLESLLKQKQSFYTIEKIVVISDGSVDNTVLKARAVKSSLIKVINNNKRLGKAKIQNILFQENKGDVLVLLDADILPVDDLMIEHLVKPFIKRTRIKLTSGQMIPLPPNNEFDSIISWSVTMKKQMFDSYKNGNNLYNCCGRVRAFHKDIIKKFIFPDTMNEDTYSYLWTIFNGYSFQYVKKSAVYYRLPQTFFDHIKQSTRFQNGISDLSVYFTKALVSKEHRIPFNILISSFLVSLIRQPFIGISYLGIIIYSFFFKFFVSKSVIYNPSSTSKVLAK